MSLNLRKLGVHGKNAVTRKSLSVVAADFGIAGLIGIFERKYAVSMEIDNPSQAAIILGGYVDANTYGRDVVDSFFSNLKGTAGKLFVKSHVGYTGSAIDAVVANKSVNDGAATPTLKFSAAYQTIDDYGAQGNRTARKITMGSRFSTTVSNTLGASDVIVPITGLLGIKVGDLLKLTTGEGTAYAKVQSLDEANSQLTVVSTFGIAGDAGDTIDVIGFKIQTFRKSITGIVAEVETQLGKSWCTLESEVTEFYVENVHSTNKYLKVEDLASVSTSITKYPSSDTDPVFLENGADGTTPTTASHWTVDLSAFDKNPVRLLANCETIDVPTQKAVESYCGSRDDTPISVGVLQMDQTKDQLIALGAQYQRSNEVFQVMVAEWLGVTDPYTNSPSAPDRNIPNVGAVMGAWIQAINNQGIHFIPCTDQIILAGVNSLANNNLGNVDDQDRTDIANMGINIIQFIAGSGFRIRNLFTLSTDDAAMFSNAIMMRNYIKVSATDSLKSDENFPNSFQRIQADVNALNNFLYKLWFKGSTNSVPEGETFGQFEKDDGTLSGPSDAFAVQGDAVNNPISSIQAGNRNLDVAFTFPAPTGSIEIDVALVLH
jgi:hypothetical protein